jgi:hypothetical protein
MAEGFIFASDTVTSASLIIGNSLGGSLVIAYNGSLIAPFLGKKISVIASRNLKLSLPIFSLTLYW